MDVIKEDATLDGPGEKSGDAGKKISEDQFMSNFQSISSVMNNVDEVDQRESQTVSEFSKQKEPQSPKAIPDASD